MKLAPEEDECIKLQECSFVLFFLIYTFHALLYQIKNFNEEKTLLF